MYRDTHIIQISCTLTGKNHAVLRLFRPQKSTTPIQDHYLPASMHLATLTKFYRRAVSKNATVEIGLAQYPDKFLIEIKFCGTLSGNVDAQMIP